MPYVRFPTPSTINSVVVFFRNRIKVPEQSGKIKVINPLVRPEINMFPITNLSFMS